MRPPSAESRSGGIPESSGPIGGKGLQAWIRDYGDVSTGDGPGSLMAGAGRALDTALSRPGRRRDAAHALLAADGLLTLALERFVESTDPEAGFRSVLRVVIDRVGDER